MNHIILYSLRRRAHLGPELLWIIAGQITAAIAGLVTVRVFTARMGPEVYGNLNLGITLAVLVSSVLLAPLVQTYLRLFSAYSEQRHLGVLIQSLKPLVLVVAIVLGLGSAVALAGAGLIWSARWGLLVALSLLYVIALGLTSLSESFQVAARRRAIVAFHQALVSWARIPIVLILISGFGNSGPAALLGYAVTGAIILLSQYYFLLRLVRPIVARENHSPEQEQRNEIRSIYRQVWSFGAPFIPMALFTWLQLYSDRWALEFTIGTRSVGLYAAVIQLAGAPIALLGNSALQFVQPIAFAQGGDGTDQARLRRAYRSTNQFSGIVAAVILFGVVGLWMFGDKIMHLLTAPSFWGGAYLLPWVGLAAGLNVLAGLQAIIGFVHNRSRDYVFITGLSGIIAVVLNFSLARSYGITGIVYSSLIAAIVRLVLSARLANRLSSSTVTPRLGT